MIKNLIDLAEQGILPDFLIRSGIRRMQKERLAEVGLDYEPSFGEWDITDMNESPWS